MTSVNSEIRAPFRVVLGDANVLYSRVLRDYLLYAMAARLIRVHWSPEILGEVVEHLIGNLDHFNTESGAALIAAMNRTFPYSEVTATADHLRAVETVKMPDEDDRHVLAAAVAAEVDILCTDNIKHFPRDAIGSLGIEVLSADALLSMLVEEFQVEMIAVHGIAVAQLPGATNDSTIAALRRANATKTADLMAAMLSHS